MSRRLAVAFLPALLLAACSPFERGREGVMRFELCNGFWAAEFPPSTPVAAGGRVQLVGRYEGEPRAFEAVSLNPDVAETEAALQPYTVTGTEETGLVGWIWPKNPGDTVIELRENGVVTDSVRLTVKRVDRLEWDVEEEAARTNGGGLRFAVGETVHLIVTVYDDRGRRLAGSWAFAVEYPDSGIAAAPEQPRGSHCFPLPDFGPPATVLVEGRTPGRGILRVRGIAGSPAVAEIPVEVVGR